MEYNITKVGDKQEKPPVKSYHPQHKTKKAHKSILKVKGVADPAKSTRHSVRMLTAKGNRKMRRTLKRKIRNMSKEKIDTIFKKSNSVLNPSTPSEITKEILGHAVSAGFVSL